MDIMSPTRQANPGRLFMDSRMSGSCSVNIETVRMFCRFGGGRYNIKNVVCCTVE